MSSAPIPDPDSLAQLRRLDRACGEFEAAWQQVLAAGSVPPRIEHYLDRAGEPDRPRMLRELLALELEYRQKTGERPTPAEYAQRFPRDSELIEAAFSQRTGGASSAGVSESTAPRADPLLSTTASAKTWSETDIASIPPPHIPGFEIRNEIPGGGMGIVYRAWQQSLERDVAIKVLRPALARDPAHLERFRQEAKLAGRLTDAHLLPVHDILVVGDNPVLVLPYIKGGDLEKVIRDRRAAKRGEAATADRHPWAALGDAEYLQRVLPRLDHVVDAVAALHRAKVLHRDIKPANVLLDEGDNVWLSDFGLALLAEEATGAGAAGTRGFVSPQQQVSDTPIDARSDVFSLGVTLYQALSLELPYGRHLVTPQTPLPPPPSHWQPLLTAGHDAVVLKALAPSREQRHESGIEFQEDWRRLRQGKDPWALKWRLAVAALVAMLIGALVYSLIPPPPPTQGIHIVTEPKGAHVVLVPIDEEPYDVTDGEPIPARAIRPEQTTPLTLPRIPPGTYLIEAEVPGYGFHEVYRVVPAPDSNAASATFAHARWQVLSDGTIELPNIEIPRDGVVKGMTRFAGGTFTMGARRVPDLPEAFRQMLSQVAPPTDKDVPAFFLDQTETTIGEYQQGGGNLHPALAGLPGSHPVTLVGFDEAVAYAERMGKRLPTEVEYEFAATVGGTQGFPWGEEEARVVDWTFGAAGEPDWDRTPTQPPVYGLYSNVAEWTLSWLRPYRTPPFKLTDAGIIEGSRRGRVVRGGPSSLAKGEINPTEWKLGPEWRWALPRDSQYPGLGFRCARSERPRFLAQASSGGP